MFKEGVRAFLSCFYLGYIPFAPGTFGSILGFLFCVFIHMSWMFLFVLSIVSVFFISFYNEELDPSWIVIDEFLGIMLCLLLIQAFCPYWNAFSLILGFLFFRLFDIWKPVPIRPIDQYLLSHKKTHALAVVLDDLLAGIMAFGFTYLVLPPMIH
ncbi:MAG: phosphatidylglycerophosphatase A [Alphaproteobacteria bacterium]|nr:MAG: phosphatidylglycerophosphatase A [Alphaproteobacteria bacterium]